MKWADENERHRNKNPKQMPKKCLTKEGGEINLLPTTVSQHSLLAHDKKQRKSGDNTTAFHRQSQDTHSHSERSSRPVRLIPACPFPKLDRKAHYVLHDDGQRNIPGQLTLPSHPANTAFTATDTSQHLDPVQMVKDMGSTLQSRFPCSPQQM